MSFTKEMIFQYTWKLNTENHLVFLSFHEESVSAAPKKEKKRKEKRERGGGEERKRKLYLGVFDMAMQGHGFE